MWTAASQVPSSVHTGGISFQDQASPGSVGVRILDLQEGTSPMGLCGQVDPALEALAISTGSSNRAR